MNKNERNVESTSSVESNEMGTWQAAMADAPDFNVNKSDHRERAVVTPLPSLSPEERRAKLKVVRQEGGKIVARSAEEELAARKRTINTSELSAEASDIGTSIEEAQARARMPESEAEGGADAKESRDGQDETIKAIVDELAAIEKAISADEQEKSEEEKKIERRKKFGAALLKIGAKTLEIVASAAAGAAIPALVSLL